MQVLCKISDTGSDVHCSVCGQGFLVYWSRTSKTERQAARQQVAETLANQHATSPSRDVHPRTGFNVPDWPGHLLPPGTSSTLPTQAHFRSHR